MRNNFVSPLALVAAFVAGALVLTPFVSRAEPRSVADRQTGEIVFTPNNSSMFLVRSDGGVYLFEIEVVKKNEKYIRRLTHLDYKPAP